MLLHLGVLLNNRRECRSWQFSLLLSCLARAHEPWHVLRIPQLTAEAEPVQHVDTVDGRLVVTTILVYIHKYQQSRCAV